LAKGLLSCSNKYRDVVKGVINVNEVGEKSIS